MDAVRVRADIDSLERRMARLPQVELAIRHYSANGLYAREMRVPGGVLMTGLVHRTETIGIMVKGKMIIVNDDGVKMLVTAPYTHVGKPGTKRVGYALEDVIWTTIHRTDLTDLKEIEKEQFVIREGDVNMFDFSTGRVKPSPELNRDDFHRMLVEYNLDPVQVRAQSENDTDRVDIDLPVLGVEIRRSDIEGVGVFPIRPFDEGEVVGPARISGMRTQLGRYVNHSYNPNSIMVLQPDGDVTLRTVRAITTEEITTDYRYTLTLSGVLPAGVGGAKCPA